MNTNNKLVTENMGTITRICAGFNGFEAAELVQEVVIHLLGGAADKFDPARSSARNFVANVAKNRCASIVKRHENSRRGRSVDTVGVATDEGEPVGFVLADTDTPFAANARREAVEAIAANEATLTEREAAFMAAIRGAKSLGEVAESLGVSRPTVTRLRASIIEKLGR